MTEEKLIVIGCDDTEHLSSVLHTIRETTYFSHNIISATRVSDVIGITRSIDPDLIILCFRNNQLALSDIHSFAKKPEVPALCLTRKFENETLRWSKNHIVFTYPLDHVGNEECFNSRINSIFLLRSRTNVSGSFADAAIQHGSSRNLSRYVMELDQKAEVLSKVKDRIAELYGRVDEKIRSELSAIVSMIRMSANNGKIWDDFKLYFEKTDPGFLQMLSRKYPLLTPIDLKYCCYLKMNMTNDDIRNLLGINQESVRTHQYRLKKKMSLPKEQDLRSYLRTVSEPESQVA